MTAISDKYAQLGGATGFLGAQVTAEIAAANGGLKQEFRNGTIYWHSRTGAFEVHGAIHARWLTLGGEGSAFGYPTSDETTAHDGVGKFNNFENASVFWHPSTGAFEVHGLIRERWRAMGAEMSMLGYPMSDESTTPDGLGRYNHFQNGSIYWTRATGAHEIYGLVRTRWAELRWERGLLGYPISTPYTEVRNRIAFLVALFQHGKIEVNSVTQRVSVEKFASASSPNYSIPIVAYRVSDDDGGRPCAITVDGVQQWVNEANQVYAAAGVQFVYDGVLRELRDTQVNNLTGEGDPSWVSAKNRLNQLAAQHRSVVVVHRALIGGGFSWWTYDFVAMSFFDAVHLNALSILAHELGHHFGLPHTHGREFPTVREAENYVLSARSIEELDGDRSVIDDTPPDPQIAELRDNTSIEAITLGGQAFALARKNIMSYWNHGGKGQLSHSQIDRVRQLVLERHSRYLKAEFTPHAIETLSPVTAIAPARDEILVAGIAKQEQSGRLMYAHWTSAKGWRGWVPFTSVDYGRTQGFVGLALEDARCYLLWVGPDGWVYHRPRESGGQWGLIWPVGNSANPPLNGVPGGAVHGVSCQPGMLHVFYSNAQGSIIFARRDTAGGGTWPEHGKLSGGVTSPGGHVTAVSKRQGKLDAFCVGTDGGVYTASWSVGGRWSTWTRIGNVVGLPGSYVSAVSRNTDKIDIFVVDTQGRTMSAAWEPTPGWRGWWHIQNGMSAPTGLVTAVSRGPDLLDIFTRGTDDRVYTSAWSPAGGWGGWWSINDARTIGPVWPVSCSRDKLDILFTSPDGIIRTAAWPVNGKWGGPWGVSERWE